MATPDTGYAVTACLVELDDHRLWALIAGNLQAAAAVKGFPPMDTGLPPNACLNELSDHTNIAIAAFSAAQLAA